MKIKRFEDIKSWIEARILTKDVYKATYSTRFSKDFGLIDQIRRASVSIMANISEGFDSQSSDEFIRFLIYARRSCSEVQSHLYVALDQDYLKQDKFNYLYEKSTNTAKLINGFITYLRSSK
jgi:four helix bundle protein